MNLFLPMVFLFPALAVAGCEQAPDTQNLSPGPAVAGTAPTASRQQAAQTATLRLRLLRVTDPAMGNEEAFRMLIPEDWHVEGGVVWRPELATLAYAAMRISSPSGPERVEIFPVVPLTWSERGYIGFPTGSLYLGQVVQPPADIPTFLQQAVLPQFRGEVNPRITGGEDLPEVAEELAASIQEPGATKKVVARRTRIEYQEGGRWLEEDIYCVMVYAQTYLTPGVTMWGPERLYSVRAEKGKLDARTPLLHAMGSSLWISPSWFNKYLQLREMWIQSQIAAIRSAGELSRYLSRTSDEISALRQEAWEQRQASQDRISERFSEHIRGVETYHDPFQDRPVQLPSGYSDVWVSRNGEYILSTDVNFNPNVATQGTWQRLGPKGG